MENPLSKFVPFLVGEFPRPFQDLYKKVSQNEQINNENLEKELWQAYEFGSRHHEGQKRQHLDQAAHAQLEEAVSRTIEILYVDGTVAGLVTD